MMFLIESYLRTSLHYKRLIQLKTSRSLVKKSVFPFMYICILFRYDDTTRLQNYCTLLLHELFLVNKILSDSFLSCPTIDFKFFVLLVIMGRFYQASGGRCATFLVTFTLPLSG